MAHELLNKGKTAESTTCVWNTNNLEKTHKVIRNAWAWQSFRSNKEVENIHTSTSTCALMKKTLFFASNFLKKDSLAQTLVFETYFCMCPSKATFSKRSLSHCLYSCCIYLFLFIKGNTHNLCTMVPWTVPCHAFLFLKKKNQNKNQKNLGVMGTYPRENVWFRKTKSMRKC